MLYEMKTHDCGVHFGTQTMIPNKSCAPNRVIIRLRQSTSPTVNDDSWKPLSLLQHLLPPLRMLTVAMINSSGIASSTPSNYSVSTPARSLRLTLPAGRPASTVLESATRARYENQRSQFPQLSSNDNLRLVTYVDFASCSFRDRIILRQYAYTPVSHSSIPQRTLQHRPASSLASKHMPPPPIPYERSGPGPGADESRTNPSANPEGPAHKRFRTPVFSNSRWPGKPIYPFSMG